MHSRKTLTLLQCCLTGLRVLARLVQLRPLHLRWVIVQQVLAQCHRCKQVRVPRGNLAVVCYVPIYRLRRSFVLTKTSLNAFRLWMVRLQYLTMDCFGTCSGGSMVSCDRWYPSHLTPYFVCGPVTIWQTALSNTNSYS